MFFRPLATKGFAVARTSLRTHPLSTVTDSLPARRLSVTSRHGNFDSASIQINGTTNQTLLVKLGPHETVQTSNDTLIYKSAGVSNIERKTVAVWSALNLAYLDVYATENKSGTLTLGTDCSSSTCNVSKLSLAEHGNELYCEPGMLLFASSGIKVKLVRIPKPPGFLFTNKWWKSVGCSSMKLTGDGNVFLRSSSTLTPVKLGPGDEACVDMGCLVAFTTDASMRAERWAPAFPFLVDEHSSIDKPHHAIITGPGTLWKQDAVSTWQENMQHARGKRPAIPLYVPFVTFTWGLCLGLLAQNAVH